MLCQHSMQSQSGSVDAVPESISILGVQVKVSSCALTTCSEFVDATIGSVGEIAVTEVFESILDVLFRVGGLCFAEEHLRCLTTLLVEESEEFTVGVKQ